MNADRRRIGAADTDVARASFERHRREQLVRGLEATPAQRLQCLEAMIEFAGRAGALPRRPAKPETTA